MRAQSHVVGVALLLGLTVLALGGLTVAVGSVIDGQTASADATRIADGMDAALQPVETTGSHTGELAFTEGRLTTVDREVHILENGSVRESREVDALVFEAQDRRVAFLAGAVVRGRGTNAWLETEPRITASERNGVLVAGVARLGTRHTTIGGKGTTSVTLRTNVSHTRTDLGEGRFGVAIETTTPRPFERYFERHDATVTRADIDGDGTESVIASYAGRRQGYLVVHDLSLEVGNG